MTRSCSVRPHNRTLPSRFTPEVLATCDKLIIDIKAERERRLAKSLDHMTAMLEAALAMDIAEFGEGDRG